MAENAGVHVETCDEISLVDIFEWVVKWWRVILIAGIVGLVAGYVAQQAPEKRFTVSLEAIIAGMPLGAPAFIHDISTSMLREQIGADALIAFDSRKGTVSLTERDLPEDMIMTRKAVLLDAVKVLSDRLAAMATEEYARMQASFSTMPASPEAYAALKPLRLYLAALDEGLIKPASVVSQSERKQGPASGILPVMGLLIGAGIGAVLSLIVGQLRRRRDTATT